MGDRKVLYASLEECIMSCEIHIEKKHSLCPGIFVKKTVCFNENKDFALWPDAVLLSERTKRMKTDVKTILLTSNNI